MLGTQGEIKLSDLIDIKLLQELQDTVAYALGVASLITDKDGAITEPSNFTDMCINFTRKSKEGCERCNKCDIAWGKIAAEKGKPVIYDCHAGLTDFAAPIMVNGQHIASIYGGQVLTKKPDEQYFRQHAKELGIDENEYINALKKVKVIPKETVDKAAKILYVIANTISEIAHKNLKLIIENKKEVILRDIIEKIRKSLDIEEIKHEIATQIGIFFNASSAHVAYYDYNTQNYIITPNSEFRTSNEAKSWEGLNLEEIEGFKEYIMEQHIAGKDIIFNKLDNYLEENNLKGTPIEKFYKEFGFVASASVNIYYKDKYVGNLVVNFNKEREFSKEEIYFLKTIANHAGTAFHQAELLEKEKNTAKSESLLRKIIESVRESLDINEIKLNVVNEVGKAFHADRCYFRTFDKNQNKFLAPDVEYLSSEKIQSEKNEVLNQKGLAYFTEELNKRKKGFYPILVDEQFAKAAGLEKYFKDSGIKADYAMPILNIENELTYLVLHFTEKAPHLSEEDEKMLEIIAKQVDIALNQARLYAKEKKTKEMEIALRDTIKIIRSTLDAEKIKTYFLNIACNYFDADRCLFDDFDKTTNKFLPFKYEVLKTKGLKSLLGVSVENDFPEFADKLKNKKRNIIIKDVSKTISRCNENNYKAINTLKNNDTKSDYGFLVTEQEDILGILILHYIENKRILTHEELEFLKILRDQAGIALQQAKNFEKTRKQAEIESLLRQVTEATRSTLNLDETLDIICRETAKIFNVQRTAISTYNNYENYADFTIKKEFLLSPNILSIKEHPLKSHTGEFWGEKLLGENDVFAIDNINDYDGPEIVKKLYNELGVKSIIGTAIKKGNDIWGTLVLSECKNERHWTKDEKALLGIIANVIYMAINQAELFNKSQKEAENEQTLRRIMLSCVQSFDKKDIIKSIVEETGKLFKADRCFYIEIDSETQTNKPIEQYAEYLSSEEIQSHVPIVPTKAETGNFVATAKDELSVYSDDVKKEELPEATKLFFERINVKSYLNIHVMYGDKLYGTLVLHFVKEKHKFTKEEIDIATAIAHQSAIIINRTELYEMTKLQAEREKISKNIIEILRSSIDKTIIKKLFVKNIGKFFDADRVFLAEYDSKKQVYLPVDKDSEYLSNPGEKSFIGYDWTQPEAAEYIQPLLEKREFNITNIDKYLETNPKSQDFINLFINADVKSSYNFPVLFQNQIMGYFCIEFTQNIAVLSEEDINRVRNMCTQAGIALYHAELYQNAQQCNFEKESFKHKFTEQIKQPTLEITDITTLLIENEFEKPIEIEYLNKIINSCNQLLELTKEITNE